jgi:uncharacterized membrane protein HdeD (DUF308 family)
MNDLQVNSLDIITLFVGATAIISGASIVVGLWIRKSENRKRKLVPFLLVAGSFCIVAGVVGFAITKEVSNLLLLPISFLVIMLALIQMNSSGMQGKAKSKTSKRR